MTTTIKDFFSAWQVPESDPFYNMLQPVKNSQLSAWLREMAIQDKTMAWLSDIVHHYDSHYVSPKRATEALEAFGLKTIEDTLEFAEAVNKTKFDPMKLRRFTNPRLNKDLFTKTVTRYQAENELKRIVPGILGKWGVDNLIIKDTDYLLIPDPQHILDTSDSDKFRYISQRRDCDDKSLIMEGWLSEQGLGNLALGEIHADLYQDEKHIGGHSFLFMLCEPKTQDVPFDLWWADGEDDSLWQHGEIPTWKLGANRFELRKMFL